MEERISTSPGMFEGRPYITGTRISVAAILELIKAGYTFEKILETYPQIERQDIQACLGYAIRLIEEG